MANKMIKLVLNPIQTNKQTVSYGNTMRRRNELKNYNYFALQDQENRLFVCS